MASFTSPESREELPLFPVVREIRLPNPSCQVEDISKWCIQVTDNLIERTTRLRINS